MKKGGQVALATALFAFLAYLGMQGQLVKFLSYASKSKSKPGDKQPAVKEPSLMDKIRSRLGFHLGGRND